MLWGSKGFWEACSCDPTFNSPALAEFQSISAAPPNDQAKFALKLLGIFFTQEQLAVSNYTKAEGRQLLDPTVLQAIKGANEKKLIWYFLFSLMLL